MDFDGDGVADALIAPVEAPGHIRHKTTGSITALARSGRDGRVIWRKQIDPLESWLEPQSGDTYELSAFPLPVGDIDRDGTADVIVRKWLGAGRLAKRRGVTLAVELLSGRTGATIWSGGPSLASSAFQGLSAVDWAEPCVVEANGTPDVIVGLNVAGARCSLARVSGRDGRVRWEAALSDAKVGYGGWVRFFDDFDGDGSADALVLLPGVPNMPRSDHALVAISLRTGKQLWSQELHYMFPSYAGEPHVGDVDGDGRPDVVTLEDFAAGKEPEPRIRVFDGRDGSLRWTWWLPKEQFPNPRSRAIALANFRGDGTRDVCLSFHSPYPGGRRILVLDSQGKERAHRDVVDAASSALKAGDLDGDGRDELLVSYGGRVHAWDRDLKELWSSPTSFETVDQIVPATPGPPREVILMPAVALDAATGRPRWTGQAPLVQSSPQFMPRMLDAGDATRPPLLLGDGLGATVCRVAMATEANGSIAPPRGQTVRVRGWAQNDPRWARPLPWRTGLAGEIGVGGFFASMGLALVNVVLPLMILRLAARPGRVFKVWVLLMLPIAVAVPLTSLLTLEPWLRVYPAWLLSTERRAFLTGTVAGLPIVYYAVVLGGSVIRGRWRVVLALLGLSVLMTVFVAGGWIWHDRRFKAELEHHDWDGWYWAWLAGAYVAAVLWVLGRGVVGGFRVVRRWPEARASGGNVGGCDPPCPPFVRGGRLVGRLAVIGWAGTSGRRGGLDRSGRPPPAPPS